VARRDASRPVSDRRSRKLYGFNCSLELTAVSRNPLTAWKKPVIPIIDHRSVSFEKSMISECLKFDIYTLLLLIFYLWKIKHSGQRCDQLSPRLKINDKNILLSLIVLATRLLANFLNPRRFQIKVGGRYPIAIIGCLSPLYNGDGMV